jgi:predicted phosphodiesterase
MTTERTIIAEKYIKDHTNITGKRTIARHLHELYPDIFPTVEVARNTVRWITGSLVPSGSKILNPIILKDEEVNYDETWHNPFIIPDKDLGIMNDLHGQFMDVSAVNTAISIFIDKGIKNLLINGDLIDNYYLSKFQKKMGRMKIIEEFNFCRSFLERIRPHFDNVYFKRGNHDQYVDRFLMNYPGLEGAITLDERLTLTGLQIKEIHDLQEIRIGDLSIFHGHEKQGFFTPELVAKSFITWYQKYSGRLDVKVLFAHHHITDNYVMRNIDGSFAYGYGVGCLCKRLAYNPYPRWNHGIAEVRVDSKGITSVDNYEI